MITPYKRGINTPTQRLPYGWLLLMNTLWAIGYPVTAIALKTGESPSFLAAVRLIVAFLLMTPLLIKVKTWSWTLVAQGATLGLMGFSLPIWLQIIGLHDTDPAVAAIFVSLEPTLTILLAAVIFRVKVRWWQKIALGLAVFGCWILTGEPRPDHLNHLLGDLALVASILCFSAYNVYSPRLSARLEPGPAAALTFGFGALGSVVIYLIDPGVALTHVTFTLLWSNAYMALGATGLSYFLWLYVVNRHPITTSALFLFVQPLMGTVISIVLGQSPLTFSLLLGAVLILAAMILGQEHHPHILTTNERL